MTYPHSYDFVSQEFEAGGCTLLAKKYKSGHTKMSYICSCGNISEISYTKFKMGRRCNQCALVRRADKQRLTFEYVKKQFTDRKCKLLAKEYRNVGTKMPYICSCGNKSEINYNNFKNGQRCQDCGNNKRADKQKLSLDFVKQEFKNAGCILLAKKYVNFHARLSYICSCGNKSEISYSSFRFGSRCKSCGEDKIAKAGADRRHSFEKVKKAFKAGRCVLLAKEYTGFHTKMPYICSCGGRSEISYRQFKSGSRCKQCGIKKSTRRGEDHPRWNHNLTSEERIKKRSNSGASTWKKHVKERDGHACQGCASIKNLHAHHILSYKKHKKLRAVLSNGVTLCRDCHIGFHRMYKGDDYTDAQLTSYLKG